MPDSPAYPCRDLLGRYEVLLAARRRANAMLASLAPKVRRMLEHNGGAVTLRDTTYKLEAGDIISGPAPTNSFDAVMPPDDDPSDDGDDITDDPADDDADCTPHRYDPDAPNGVLPADADYRSDRDRLMAGAVDDEGFLVAGPAIREPVVISRALEVSAPARGGRYPTLRAVSVDAEPARNAYGFPTTDREALA